MKRKKKVIYLDQFASSHLASATKGDVWFDARQLLNQAVAEEKCICPIPMEHYMETGKRTQKYAIEQDTYFTDVACNKRFRYWEEIVADEIMYYIKYKYAKIKWTTYFREIDYQMSFDNEEFIMMSKKAISSYTRNIEREKEELNSFRSIARKNEPRNNCNDDIFIDSILHVSANKFASIFDKIAYGKKIPDSIYIKCPKAQRIALLLCHKRFNGLNFHHAANEFRRNQFNNIPSLNTFYNLKALMAVGQIAETVNDEIDTERISSGILVSDVLFTDSKQKNRIQALGLDNKYKTIVLSAKENDVKSFVDYLYRICNS